MKIFCKSNMYRQREAGAVLIVGLIMVLLISIIGLSAIRSSNLQESMAGNMRDRNIAFQAAESALVEGEDLVNIFGAAPFCTNQPTTCYLRSQAPFPLPQTSVIFLSDAQLNLASRATALGLTGVQTEPRFMIEELTAFKPTDGAQEVNGPGLTELLPYRITTRSTGLSPNTTVILQTTYNRFAN